MSDHVYKINDRQCPICGKMMKASGWLFYCHNRECRINGKVVDSLPLPQTSAPSPETAKANGQGHVWLSRTAHESLMRYWQEGEKAREILLRLGNGKPEMTLLQVVEDLAASVRDSSGGPVAGSI